MLRSKGEKVMIPSVYQKRRRIIGGSMLRGAGIGAVIGGVGAGLPGIAVAGSVGGLFGGFYGLAMAPLNPKRLRWYK